MAQHDYVIANQSGAAFRADLNNALAAIVSQNSGAVEPSVTYSYQPWADTTTGLFKIRNAANSAWITLYQLDGEWSTIALENGSATAPSLYFKDSGTDTGVYSPGVDQVGIATGGVQRVNFNGATEVVFNDGGNDVDFRIEGDTEPDLFKIDAGTDQVQVKNLNGGPLAGTRNRIINGDMRIDQRNAGASVTAVTPGSIFPVDRWQAECSASSKFTAQRSTVAPAGFTNSLLATSTSAYSVAAGDFFLFRQNIEGFNTADLNWGAAGALSATLSFWVRSSLTGSFSGSLRNASDTRSYVFSYTINAANTWEYKTITIPGDTSGTWLTDNSKGIALQINLGTGSTFSTTAGAWSAGNYVAATGSVSLVGTTGATFYLTGVQLEAGTVATPFERRSYGQELALCQRYAHAAVADGSLNSYMPFGIGRWYSSTEAQIAIRHPMQMRTVPTLESNTAVGTFYINTNGSLAGASPTGIAANELGINVSTITASYSTGGRTTGQATTLYSNNTSFARLVFSAEL